MIISLLPKHKFFCSPYVSKREVPPSKCTSSLKVEDPVAVCQRCTLKRDSSQSFRAQTTQATSDRSCARANASGCDHFNESEPGTEYVRWNVADSKICRLTHGGNGLKPVLLANIVRNSLRYVRNLCTEQPVCGGQLRGRLCPAFEINLGADLGADFKADFGADFWGQYQYAKSG